ncbi:MAG: ImmA/IrrE family metallo-endopeptidase [Acidimicrobiaceae bacterium]|nr:ImmA/IrrE family metallo-endopeptidase [Acidimicrobiaceae bacterium]MYA75289.1 ImmA/IrrE family metallo-endopeptidase [Acidimicrobiaceae bacterium]MYD07876.1 ImmA/IrrE family metallo-endopeptidase [Acidimicrobiaceae bacterium]MYG54622.1 ImmA/IrrE family metallo-endopeptidase [Acidimicrobiaceae bacterium]MYI58825.1 ImmA/IrrE family metallo-endopeptidase [Acidimicrobiaceae bacterium]
MVGLGEAIATARRARGLTQGLLAERLGITQAALSRYENELREPTDDALYEIASTLGVVPDLLSRADRMEGALAVGAHMRRRATAKPTVWRRLEAQLNLHRLHAQRLFDELDLRTELTIPWLDPFEYEPTAAARIVRLQWRMPSGPVRDLAGWMEAAGCLIIDTDFETTRVDGLSQWSGPHPVVMLNVSAPTDRRRLTLAHELGHLCLHSQGVPDDVEADATAFAAEFLMPAETIRPQLRNLTLGRLHDLKRQWGVSMQALIERAHELGTITSRERTNFYKRFSARGWRTREPLSDELAQERPRLASEIGKALLARGHNKSEAAKICGYTADNPDNPFINDGHRLRLL